MRFHILTTFPGVFSQYFSASIVGRAHARGLVETYFTNIADFTVRNTRRVDDRPYGGLPGTILMAEPLARAIDTVLESYGSMPMYAMSAKGELFCHKSALSIATSTQDVLIVCGHYEGIDQRVIDTYQIQEVSIGEYILSSGELSAMVVVDAVTRLLPGVISLESLSEESFSGGLNGKKEYPQYTRPDIWRGLTVPSELLSGDPRSIDIWKKNHLS